MIDWTKLTDDPVNEEVRSTVIKYLLSIRKPLGSYDAYLAGEAKGKTALDIGVCEHTLERMRSPRWKHNLIRNNATFSLGVDIIPELVSTLKGDGVNVVLCDATSETFLGQKFDVVHAGDVIEHVDSTVALLKFCARHLNQEGKIIVRTPNAYCHAYVHLHKKIGTDKSNLEHMCYIFPTHAMEIARRCGLVLSNYRVQYPGGFSLKGVKSIVRYLLRGKVRHAWAELFASPESYSTVYVYEFALRV